MAGIGIGINVDTRQIAAAKASIDKTKDALQHLGDPVELAGKTGLKETSVLIKRLTEDINRLKGIAASSDKQGGLLTAKQFQEAASVSSKLGKNMQDFAAQISKARQEITRMKGELKTLDQQESNSNSASERSKIAEQRTQLRSRLRQQQKSYRKLEGQEDQFQGEFNEYTDSVQGAGLQRGAPASGSGLKKAIGYGAALIGAGTVMGFMLESMSRAGAISQGRTGLEAIGGSSSVGTTKVKQKDGSIEEVSAATNLGFGPAAELQMAQAVAKKGNYGARGTLLAMQSARAFDMDGSTAANMVGSTGALTGMTQEQTRQYIEAMRDFGKLGRHNIGTRIEEYVQVNQRLMQTISATSGGAKIGSESASFVAGLQASLWSNGPSGHNANILSKMNSTIASNGGSPGEQLFKWSALGGDKLPAGDLGALWEFKKRMSLGVGDSENVRGMMNKAMSFGGGADGALTKFTLASQFKMTETETESLIGSIEKEMATYIDRQKKKGKTVTREDIYGSPEMYREVFTSSRAAGGLEGDAGRGTDERTRVQAGIEDLQVKIGDAMLSVVDPIKKGLTDVANSINGGDFTQAIKDFNRLLSGGYGAEALVDKGNKNFRGYEGSDWMQSLGFTISEKSALMTAKGSSHDKLAGWMKTHDTIGSLGGDYKNLAQYNANLAHLQKEDPEALKGINIISTEQLDALARSIIDAATKMATAADNIEAGARLVPSSR